MNKIKPIIEQAFEEQDTHKSIEGKNAVQTAITGLSSGQYRVAEKINGQWVTHEWLKKAVLLGFVSFETQVIQGHFTQYYDKVDSKYKNYDSMAFQREGVRIV